MLYHFFPNRYHFFIFLEIICNLFKLLRKEIHIVTKGWKISDKLSLLGTFIAF